MSFEFYALPDELRLWLAKLISQERIWCLAWYPAKGGSYDFIRNKSALKGISFEAEYEDELMFFIGRTDLSDVVWYDTPHGKRVDFIRSQAIQFVPSTIVKGYILLEGRVAIMRRSEYEHHGIDPKPLSYWYRQIRKSLVSIMTQDCILVQRTISGKLKEWRKIGITPGAVSWRRSGCLLKQFPRGEVEFNLNPA